MPDPGCRHLGIVPLQRLGFGESGSDRAPTFDCPFTPKMPKPTPHSTAAQSWLFWRVHALAHPVTVSVLWRPSSMTKIKNTRRQRTQGDVVLSSLARAK